MFQQAQAGKKCMHHYICGCCIAPAVCNVMLLLLPLLLSQKYAKMAGPASSSLVQLLLQHGATAGNPNAAVDADNAAIPGVTALHLLACWHPGAVAINSSSSSANALASKPGSSKMPATGLGDMSAADHTGVAEQIAAATMLLEQ
jgi:hypothetical protein